MSSVIFPLINAVDLGLASFLPLTVRVLVWGVLAGIASMAIYALVSNQELISKLKTEIKEHKNHMLGPSVESHSEFVALAGKNLKSSMGLLGKVVGPALLSALPVLVIAVWMDTYHGYTLPDGPAPVVLTFVPAVTGAVKIIPSEFVLRIKAGMAAIVPPQTHPATVFISVNDKDIYSGDPFKAPSPVIAKKGWLNLFLPSANGYVHPDSPVDEIHVDLLKTQLFNGFPSWMSGWEFTYFLSIFVAAMATRLIFKIH